MLKEGFDELEGRDPLSCEGVALHFNSTSEGGSTTYTAPSLMPTAIWLGSDGWAAMTAAYVMLLLHKVFVNECEVRLQFTVVCRNNSEFRVRL